MLTQFNVEVFVGEDPVREYNVLAVSEDVAKAVAINEVVDAMGADIHVADLVQDIEVDADLTAPVGLPVTLSYDDALEVLNAISLAQEDLGYRIDELSDTGDYEPEDIARMSVQCRTFQEIYKKILAQSNTTS